MGRKHKARLIPEQNRRICGGICLCQFTMVMSCVALVYLTVAIYMPSHRAFRSGLEPVPVMCQTVALVRPPNCQWASCGEWCLTKTSGFCPQINVTVRRNGTDVRLLGCEAARRTACPPVLVEDQPHFNCNNGSECERLTGLFRCKTGHCLNMTEAFDCRVHADGKSINSERENIKLNGHFVCKRGSCTPVKHAFECDRLCDAIDTAGRNVLVEHEDSVVSARCELALALHEANGTEPGRAVNATEFWRAEQADEGGGADSPGRPRPGAAAAGQRGRRGDSVLLLSCRELAVDDDGIRGTDCVNGSLAAWGELPRPHLNFTDWWRLRAAAVAGRPADPEQRFAPAQASLTIYNSSRLLINLEACVNTLQDECRVFVDACGRDGRNNTARSQFPCFFDKNDAFFVVARFDLDKTLRELVVAVAVPAALFVVSWATLCAITRSVNVGDDARMRCKYCGGADVADPDECGLAGGGGGGAGAGAGAGGGSEPRAVAGPSYSDAACYDEETTLVVPTLGARGSLEGRDNRALQIAA